MRTIASRFTCDGNGWCLFGTCLIALCFMLTWLFALFSFEFGALLVERSIMFTSLYCPSHAVGNAGLVQWCNGYKTHFKANSLKLTALGFFSSFGINLLMDVYGFLPLRLSFDLQFLLTIKLIKFFFLAQTIYFATYCTRLQEEAL